MDSWLTLVIGLLLIISAVFVERRREFIMAKAQEWREALSRLRKESAQPLPTSVEAPTVATPPVSSLDYERGLAHLERGERDEAIQVFTKVFQSTSDPGLKQKALEQLERLGAVRQF